MASVKTLAIFIVADPGIEPEFQPWEGRVLGH